MKCVRGACKSCIVGVGGGVMLYLYLSHQQGLDRTVFFSAGVRMLVTAGIVSRRDTTWAVTHARVALGRFCIKSLEKYRRKFVS